MALALSVALALQKGGRRRFLAPEIHVARPLTRAFPTDRTAGAGMASLADYDFSPVTAGAAICYPLEAGQFKKGG
jgi:hypothetical protein